MAQTDKDTIYVDIDDEITGIIDKLRDSNGKIVALVLPKRATVFQSIVNMKLLKRAADDAKKRLVLITSESGLLPLAGAAGVHVAKTLTSKPEIPLAPAAADDGDEEIDEDDALTADNAGDRPIGELAGAAALAPPSDEVETVELDNDTAPEDTAVPAAAAGTGAAAAAAATKPKVKKDKKLAVPNFDRFRLWLVVGGLALILLIIFLVLALTVLPKATIAIKTDATNVDVSLPLNLSTTADELSVSRDIVPAKTAQQQKTQNQQVPTTGEKNMGNKAQGSVTMSAGSCSGDVPNNIPEGTGLSNGGQTYILEDDVAFVPTVSRNKCTFQGIDSNGDKNIPITAQGAGSSYNTNGNFTVSGYPNVSASGSASGGTDNNVHVVTQNDINNAKSKLNASDDSAKQALQNQLKGEGYYAIAATFNGGTPTYTNSAEVGEQADNVTVTETVTYIMFGVHKNDLDTLVKNDIKQHIDTSKQSILDDGVDSANYNVTTSTATTAQLTMSTTATAGPELDTNTIKQNAAGKKSGDVKSQLRTNPDVTDVQIKLSPFWVNHIPKKTSKITVTIAKPTTTVNSNANNP